MKVGSSLEEVYIECFDVEGSAPLEGETIGEVLENDGSMPPSSPSNAGMDPHLESRKQHQQGDTVVAIGSNENLEAFERLLVADGRDSD